jgi:hypothetical protein
VRTIGAPERALLGGARFNVHLLLETQNALGAWVSVSSLLGADWVLSAEWANDLDNVVGTATFTLVREARVTTYGIISLSPLVGSSPANDGGPLFDYERPVRLRTACTAAGAARPADASTAWTYVFFGKITGIEAGGDGNQLVLTCLDEGSRESDAWVREETPYSDDAGQPIESVMAQIRSDWAPFLPGIVTPVSPAYMVKKFLQEKSSVLAAVRDKLALLIGFDYRWRWIDRTTFAPVFQQPERDTPVVDAVFPPTEYVAIPKLGGTGDDIRNAGRGKWVDQNGDVHTIDVFADDSIARFGGPGKGERWFEIALGADSPIRDEAGMRTLLGAAISDLAFPSLDFDIETTYFWPAEIGDYYQFGANQNQFTADQFAAVIGVTHTISRGSMRTTFRLRGKPAAAYRRWLTLPTDLAPTDATVVPLRLKNFRVSKRTPEGVYVAWDDGDLAARAAEVDYYLVTVADDVSAETAWPDETTPPTGHLDPVGQEYGPIAYPVLGSVTYAFFLPLAVETLAAGDAEKVTVNSVGVPPHFGKFTFTVNPATGLTGNAELEVIDPQTFGGTLRAWVNHDSPEDADPARVVDGSLVLGDTPRTVDFSDFFTTAFGTFATLRDIRVRPNKNKSVFFEFTNTRGVSSGVRRFTIIGGGGVIDETGNIVDKGILSARQFVDSLRPLGVYIDALPADPAALGIRPGDLVTLFDTTTDPPTTTLMRRTATGWEPGVDFVEISGQVITAQIAAAAVDITRLAGNIAPPMIVSDFSAPGGGNNVLAFDGTSLKRWTGATWTDAVPAVSITGAITEAQLAVNAVSQRVLGTLAITATNIADGAITTPKIFAGAVTTAALAADAVTASKVLAGSLTAVQIAVGSLTGDRLAANTITGGNILGRTITAGLIAVGAITATEIATRTIVADRLVSGTITGNEIAATTITGLKIVGLTITGDKIAGNTITGDKLVVNTIQAGGISAGAITAIAIAAKSVKASMMEVAVLSDIKDASGASVGLGIIVDGRLSAIATGAYIDLNATGTQPFIHHPAADWLANGSAWFSGDVRSKYFVSDNAEFAWGVLVGSPTAQARSVFGAGTAALKFYDAGNTVFNAGTGMWLRMQSYGSELWSFYDLYIKTFTNRTVYFTSDSGASGAVSFEVSKLGFFGKTPITKPTVSSTRAVQSSGYIPALFDLLQALDRLGIILDLSTL